MRRMFIAAAVIAEPVAAAVAQAPTSGPAYVAKAGAGDQYEIQSSRLLLQTTHNAKLRDFANMMIRDHTNSTAKVKAATQRAGITVPPPHLDAMGTRNVAALRGAKGEARDRLYVTQQKAAHQQALALHQGYAAHGSVPALKAVAGEIAPVVQTHLTALQSM